MLLVLAHQLAGTKLLGDSLLEPGAMRTLVVWAPFPPKPVLRGIPRSFSGG